MIGAQITFRGSFGIVTLAMTEGLEAAGLYLLYVPAIIAFFATCILLFISIAICTYSFQWARRVVCLFAYVFAALVFGPTILLPHFVLGDTAHCWGIQCRIGRRGVLANSLFGFIINSDHLLVPRFVSI